MNPIHVIMQAAQEALPPEAHIATKRIQNENLARMKACDKAELDYIISCHGIGIPVAVSSKLVHMVREVTNKLATELNPHWPSGGAGALIALHNVFSARVEAIGRVAEFAEERLAEAKAEIAGREQAEEAGGRS